MGEKRQGIFFGLFFTVFRDLYAQRGHRGDGRLKEGVGGGLIDLKIRDLERSQISGPK